MNSKSLILGLIALAFLFSFSNCKKENQLPSCTITYPNNGDEFEQGDTIVISVEANDNDGLIAEVKYYIDDIGIFSSNSFPYKYSWNTLDETTGNHIIKVIAKDNEGGSKTDECTISIIGNATVVTTEAGSITHNSAISGGNITNDGGTSILERGVCWNTSQNPTLSNNHTTDGNGSGSFTSSLTGLTQNTTYYVKAYATNSIGISYGSEESFTTLTTPTLTTTAITAITDNSAQSGGNITDNGGATVTARGVCWSTSQNPTTADSKTTDGSGTGSFTSSLTGLSSETTYYVRAYATNSVGTAYGNEVSFKTWFGVVTDYDGNVYKIVQIGTQVWMAENLKTTKYNDGTSMSLVTNSTEWENLRTPGYCWYNNEESTYKDTYGALYNWYTVETGNLCPNGWHVPTDEEWKELEMYLGMSQSEADVTGWRGTNEGSKLAGNASLWQDGDLENNAEFCTSDFSALPGGYRGKYDGSFGVLGRFGFFSSATELNSSIAWLRRLYYDNTNVDRTNYDKEYGVSVRCVKDE